MLLDVTPAGILASLLIGSIGYALFHYGRKSVRMPQLVTGLALMIFPAFVSSAAWVLALGALLLVALWGCVRAGL